MNKKTFRIILFAVLTGALSALAYELLYSPAIPHREAPWNPVFIAMILLLGCIIFITIYRDTSNTSSTINSIKENNDSTNTELTNKNLHSERYKYIIDNAADGIITINKKGIITLFSRSSEIMFGYSAAEVTGKNIKLLMCDDHRSNHDLYLKNYHETAISGIIGNGPRELKGRRKDNSPIEIELSVNNIIGTDGDEYIGIIRDITERKCAEAALMTSQKSFKNAIEQFPFSIQIFNYDGVLTTVNGASKRLWGIDDDKIGKYNILNDKELKHQGLMKYIEKAFSGTPTIIPVTLFDLIDSVGKNRWIQSQVFPIYDNFGDVNEIVLISEDTTSKMQAENERMKLNRHVRVLLESTDEGIFGVNLSGTCTFINESAVKMLGYTAAEEIVGENILLMIQHLYEDGTPYPLHNNPIFRSYTEGKSTRLDNQVLWRKNSTCFPVEYSTRPILDGKLTTGAVVIFNDITERKNSEDELKHARDSALKAFNVKSLFLANMSHELRTPMNGVLGTLDLLDDTDLNEEQNEYVKTALECGNNLMGLLNDILCFSKAESGKITLEHITFDIIKLINESVAPHIPVAQKKGINIETNIDSNIPAAIMGDPARVRQVTTNLISNAIKFTNKGKVSIYLSGITMPDNRVKINFKVVDTGIGINEKHHKHIFDSFSQGDNSTTRIFGGTGLGLSISKQLVTRMDGDIGVVSNNNCGSTFWFELTFKIPPHNVSQQDHDAPDQNKKTKLPLNILIAEDNLVNQKVTRAILKKLKCKVDIANDGEEAVAAAMVKKYDIILMDCQMPKMDGYEATENIRGIGCPNKMTPIIAVTANAMSGDDRKCIAAGMNDYIAKPINRKILLTKLNTWGPQIPPATNSYSLQTTDTTPANNLQAINNEQIK